MNELLMAARPAKQKIKEGKSKRKNKIHDYLHQLMLLKRNGRKHKYRCIYLSMISITVFFPCQKLNRA